MRHMTAEVFDGVAFAAQLEADLRKKLEVFFAKSATQPSVGALTIAAIAFTQDEGSKLYSEVKAEVAARLGIEYKIYEFLFTNPLEEILAKIRQLNANHGVTGIIIQKPRRASYEKNVPAAQADFNAWWRTMVEALAPAKDVDGLTGRGLVPPATCAAVLKIMDLHQFVHPDKALIVGRSDLLGLPLHKKLLELGWPEESVSLVGRQELAALKARPEKLSDFALIVSAVGIPNLIDASEIAPHSFLIDVGEPQADFAASCQQKARFITPVPGGVGPLTVVCLMQNCLVLAEQSQKSVR